MDECFRNNIILTFSDYGGKSNIGIYESKNSRKVIPVEFIDIINNETKVIARNLMTWMQVNNIDKIYNYKTNSGVLNHLTIRHNENKEFMLEFYFHEYDDLVINRLKYWNIDNFKIVSMYYQIEDKNKNNFRGNYKLLNGNPYLYYNLYGKKIGIKAGSFFQTNNSVLSVMYDEVIKQFIKDKDYIFLDLYCGVGIMSILIAEYYYKCYGIEINENAIFVAKHNLDINNINNCNYICSSVEDIINDNTINITSVEDKDIVIFINPPRSGLYKSVIDKLNSLKSSDRVKQIIYLSCCQKTLERDLELLDYESKIIKVYNMFPKTDHKEYLVELK